jgi:hypothetical protein
VSVKVIIAVQIDNQAEDRSGSISDIKAARQHGSYCSVTGNRQPSPRVTQWAKCSPEQPQQILDNGGRFERGFF